MDGRPRLIFAMRHFNNAQFLEAALRGAFAQTYAPLDIVFIDDASTDNGFELAQRMATGYTGSHRVILSRHERNVGVGAQINRVLELSAGEIIVLADADDVSLPGRCQRVYEAFRDGGPQLLGVDSYFDVIDAGGNPIVELPQQAAGHRSNAAEWTAEMLARGIAGPTGAVFAFRRSVLEAGPSLAGLRFHEDLVLGFRCVVLGRMSTIPDVLVLRRSHIDTLTGPIRIGWTSEDLGAWFSANVRERLRAPIFMRRDLDRFQRTGLVSAERARPLRRQIALYERELKLLRVTPRLPWWRRWTLYCGLRRVDLARHQALRLALIVVAPRLAMMFLRRNPMRRLRESTATSSSGPDARSPGE